MGKGTMSLRPRQQQSAPRSLAAAPCQLGFQRGFDWCSSVSPPFPPASFTLPQSRKTGISRGRSGWTVSPGLTRCTNRLQGKDHVTHLLHTSGHAPPLSLLLDRAGLNPCWCQETTEFYQVSTSLLWREGNIEELEKTPPLCLRCNGCHGHCISGTEQQSANCDRRRLLS